MVANVKRSRRPGTEGLKLNPESDLEARLAYYAVHPDEIEQRLRELDEDWDLERAIELEAAGTVLGGFLLGAALGKKSFVLSALAGSLLLVHTLQGGYPLLFRRLGLRSTRHIDQERYALKALRGDFAQVRQGNPQARTRVAFRAGDPAASAPKVEHGSKS